MAIRASELRIGNLIHARSFYDVRLADVPHLYHINNAHALNNVDIQPEHYEGIPITEEWLLKFGFAEDRFLHFNLYKAPIGYEKGPLKPGGSTYTASHFWLTCAGDDPHYDVPVPHIQYVHQLQNLYFALTGEELTLK